MRGWVNQSLSYAHPPHSLPLIYLSSHINGTASSNGPICPKPSRSGRRCRLRPPIKRYHLIPNNSSLLFLRTKTHLTFFFFRKELNPDFSFHCKKKKTLSGYIEGPATHQTSYCYVWLLHMTEFKSHWIDQHNNIYIYYDFTGEWWHAGFHLTTAIVGPTILTLPYAFRGLGWSLGFFCLTVMAIVTFYSYCLMSKVLEHCEKAGRRHIRFRELAADVLGIDLLLFP